MTNKRTKGFLFEMLGLILMNSAIFVRGIPIILSYTEGAPEFLPVRTQRVDVEIDKGFVVTSVSQEFYNPTDIAVNGTYSFAIPESAF